LSSGPDLESDLTPEVIGIELTNESQVSVEHARRLAALLDADIDLATGTPLPLLWHWAFFTPTTPTAELGPDGHPQLAADGSTAGLPRRMWAGGRVTRVAPLRAGRPATRRSAVSKAERKHGRSGRLLILTVEHVVEQDGEVVLTETQDLVYREPSGSMPPPPGGIGPPAAPAGGWADSVAMDTVRLFRFSAITFNSHRIHYDRDYATDQEGYPGLVVHGPLTALLLAESARHRVGDLSTFEFRASAPLFAGMAFTLVGEPSCATVALTAVRHDGTTAMTARAHRA
jgi:3-methylfumaryl-CoA hydratase